MQPAELQGGFPLDRSNLGHACKGRAKTRAAGLPQHLRTGRKRLTKCKGGTSLQIGNVPAVSEAASRAPSLGRLQCCGQE